MLDVDRDDDDDSGGGALFPQLIIPIRGSNYVTTPLGIALPWEQAVRDHNAKQPVDVIVHLVRLCHAPLLKGALAAPYFLVAHACASTLGASTSPSCRTLPAFFGNNRRKKGGSGADDAQRFSFSPAFSLLLLLLLSSSRSPADYTPEHMFRDIVAASLACSTEMALNDRCMSTPECLPGSSAFLKDKDVRDECGEAGIRLENDSPRGGLLRL